MLPRPSMKHMAAFHLLWLSPPKHWFSIELFPLRVCGYVLQMRKAFVSCRGKAFIFIFIFSLYFKSFGHCHFLVAADHHALEAIYIDFCNLTVFGSNGESNCISHIS